jgi:predicted SAM-dependent methyltransferase
MRVGKQVGESGSEIMLNIGCGYANVPEHWVNIDNSLNARLAKHPRIRKVLYKIKVLPRRLYELPWPDSIMIWDIRRGLPFANSSVRYIYASHLLEHLKREEAEFVLKECYRALKKGGIIRIVVPDLECAIREYISKVEYIEEEGIDSTVTPADEFVETLGFFDSVGRDDSWLVRLVTYITGE